MKTLAKVLSRIVNLLFYAFLAILIATIILFFCGVKPFVAMSGSMEPAIHTGSVCFVNTKAVYEEIQTGDVIAFETPNGDRVTHRVIAVTPDGLETKGDANDISDGVSTTPDNFFGKTLFSVPYVGFAVIALQRPQNIAALLIGVVMIVALSAAYSIITRKDSSEEEPE